MKIECLRFECKVCNKLASIQVFYNRSGTVKYARARHYSGVLNGKPQFEYHQQPLDYIQRKLSKMPSGKTEIDQTDHNNIDPIKPQSSTKLGTMAGPMGFEPMTFSLEG